MKAALKIHKQLGSNSFLVCSTFKGGRRKSRDSWVTQLWCGNLPILWRRTSFCLARDGRALVRRVDRQNEVTWLSLPSRPLKYDILCAGWGGGGRALRVIQVRKVPLWVNLEKLYRSTDSEKSASSRWAPVTSRLCTRLFQAFHQLLWTKLPRKQHPAQKYLWMLPKITVSARVRARSHAHFAAAPLSLMMRFLMLLIRYISTVRVPAP